MLGYIKNWDIAGKFISNLLQVKEPPCGYRQY